MHPTREESNRRWSHDHDGRVTGEEPDTGEAVTEKAETPVRIDGEIFAVDLPHGGEWACGHIELLKLLAAE
jgi:hypothetical protein